MRKSLLVLLIALVLGPTSFADMPPDGAVQPFQLPDISEQIVEVAPTSEARLTVLCFLGTECPLVKLYARRLSQFSDEFADQGVRFFGINSNRQDALEEVREYAEKYKISFPLLKDYQNVVADQVQAKRTPEVFLLDQDFVIRYRGRIDDQYAPGLSAATAKQPHLKDAIEELLAGKSVTVPYTDASGCLIGREPKPFNSKAGGASTAQITYCQDIARILQNRCVECHRTGEIGPFVLDDFDEVVGWAETVLEVIDDGRMPPWHANPDHGEFTNARHMPGSEKETLKQWVAAGMPYGDAADLPPPIEYAAGWRLPREPDLIVEMGEHAFEVPADGIVDYQYFVVDPGFTEDKWVTAAEVIPGNRSVVHHSIVFVRPPDGVDMRGLGWVAAYVPGQQVAIYPEGSAQLIPAGSKFVFQQHYTPNGVSGSDTTKVGFLFGDDQDVTHEIYTVIGMDQQFEIPPHSSDHKVEVNFGWLPDGAMMLTASPHMHLRGKSFRMWATIDGNTRTLLDVPKYDFNWQHAYQFREPIAMSSIERMDFEVVFDNSDANPVNPNPEEVVTWGDQTYEEMAIAFCQVSQPREIASPNEPTEREVAEADGGELDEQSEPQRVEGGESSEAKESGLSEAQQTFVQEQTDRLLQKFDKNTDGKITKSETPWVFRRYTFRGIDKDGDGVLTTQEITKAAQRRIR